MPLVTVSVTRRRCTLSAHKNSGAQCSNIHKVRVVLYTRPKRKILDRVRSTSKKPRIAFSVPEITKNVLLVFAKRRIQNERDGLD